MPNFRRQPTNNAKTGVFFFILYIIRTASRYRHNFLALAVLFLLAAIISAIFLFVEPIPQSQAYHNFADKRRFLCSCHGATEGLFLPPGTKRSKGFVIPNFGDVISNIVILAGGGLGLALLYINDTEVDEVEPIRKWQLQICLPIFFSSTVAISAGSTYYHWKPNDNSLVWDRLPMTLAFVSIFCFMLEEYMPIAGVGQSLLQPLLGIGVVSVVYWHLVDDLRLYALVQFLPLVAMAALLACFQPMHGGAIQQTFGLVCYAIAKACEERDYEIFHWTNKRISGHSLKHAFAGLASVLLASMLRVSDK